MEGHAEVLPWSAEPVRTSLRSVVRRCCELEVIVDDLQLRFGVVGVPRFNIFLALETSIEIT